MYMHDHACINVCMYVHIHACMYVWQHAVLYAPMYACIHYCVLGWMDGLMPIWLSACLCVCLSVFCQCRFAHSFTTPCAVSPRPSKAIHVNPVFPSLICMLTRTRGQHRRASCDRILVSCTWNLNAPNSECLYLVGPS